MRPIHLIVLGKYKNQHLEALEEDYLKRMGGLNFTLHELRARTGDKEGECQSVLTKISEITKTKHAKIILLDEGGKDRDSCGLSHWLFQDKELDNTPFIFVIGGATGHTKALKEKAHESLSLSKLTLPHKLARLFFIEQLYRALSIDQGHPYHNA
jgi:23S rRNA (pseudouridine1915-N3)-methyltransferase